ncbi:MAG: hypothetical protein LBK94_01475 [Prevotellaceae bacterium]|jgi:hypothetical protein|nr:hypothetical protein [Prevotellaceae bacterium]
MKKILVLMIAAAAIAFAGCSKDDDESVKTPPYAAGTQTWAFGSLTWSNAINDPACNKQDFDGGTKDNPLADGRSQNLNGRTVYYYSWLYVSEHAATLCPSPWRVPSRADIDDLVASDVSAEQIITSWGLGGFALGDGIYDASSHLYLWGSGATQPYFWNGYGSPAYNPDQHNQPGFQLRCVK